MAESDPQSKKKRTWGEIIGGTKEGNAIASAEYKRDMGINPSAKRISNAEASRSARSMGNPTSAPYRPSSSASRLPESKGNKPLRKAAGTYTESYDKPTAPVKAADTPKKVVTPKAKPVKAAKAAPSSTSKPIKMTAFERQKMRQLEKEGWGGRSMTSAQAKSRVEKERGYKSPVNGLSFSGKAPSKAPAKAASKGKPLSGSFASMMQGRNVKGSPTYSPSGTKKKDGFKFKDLFKKR